jgi:transmembrane protein EpsG
METRNASWSSLMSDFAIVSNEYSGRDSGYEVFVKLTQYISEDFTFFMFLTTTIFFLSFGWLIYKYVKSYLGIILIFVIYFAIFTTLVNSFMRQTVALGITLFAIRFILSRNWKYYYGLMLITISIHSSAIAAFPFYFLPLISNSKKWLVYSFAASPVLIAFLQSLTAYFITDTVYDRYIFEEVVNPVNYILLIASIALLGLFYFEEVKKIKDYEILTSAIIGTMLILPVVFMGNTLLRISYYYVFVLLLLLPNVIDRIKMPKSTRTTAYLLLICFFIFMAFRK